MEKGKEEAQKNALMEYVVSGVPESERKKMRELILAIAREHQLPIFGITILGGRPYVNVTGLDSKLQSDPRKVKRIDFEVIQRATKDNGYLAGYVGIVEFEDTPERMQMRTEIITEALRQKKSFEEIQRIIEASGLTPPIYRDEGWNSPESSPAICYMYRYSKEVGKKVPDKAHPLVENVNMMALRKATNRAKRHAVGCGLTSVEEMGFLSEKAEEVKGKVRKDEVLEPENQRELPLE